MKQHSATYDNEITAPCRYISGEFHSALEDSYSTDFLKSIIIESSSVEGKFFGYSVCHKATVVLLNKANRGSYSQGDYFTVKVGTAAQLMQFPKFYVDTVNINSKTGEVTLEGYDIVYKLNNYTFSDLNYASTFSKTVATIISDIATLLNISISTSGISSTLLNRTYTQDNIGLSGDVLLRDLCNYLAEITGSILVSSGASGDSLAFKVLSSNSVLNITKSHYYELEEGESLTLTKLVATRALNDNVAYGTEGYTQVLAENLLLSQISDSEVTTVLSTIMSNINTQLCSYNLCWIANPALEFGDRVTLTTKSGTVTTNYLGEKLEYTGGLKSTSAFSLPANGAAEAVVAESVTSTIRKTEARVDKANRKISLVVETDQQGDHINSTNIMNSINIDTSGVTIAANKINLTGYITATDLATSGSTTINGGNLTTGTINANRCHVTNLNASDIVTGTLNASNIDVINLDADNITTGSLSANRISGGTLSGTSININNKFMVSSNGVMTAAGAIINNSASGTLFDVDSSGKLSTYGGELSAPKITATSATNESVMLPNEIDTNEVVTKYVTLPNCTLSSSTSLSRTQYFYLDIPASVTTNASKQITLTVRCKDSDSASAPDAQSKGSVTFNWYLHLNRTLPNPPKMVPTYNIAYSFTFPSGVDSYTFSVPASSLTASTTYYLNTYGGLYTGTRKGEKSFASSTVGLVTNSRIIPNADSSYDLGASSLKWDDIYAANGTIQTSDREHKTDIIPISDKYSVLFDSLTPVSYKFTEGHRTHLGLIAQDVESAMTAAGIDSEEFACLIKSLNDDGTYTYGLRYTELIGLLIKEVQELKREIKALKKD